MHVRIRWFKREHARCWGQCMWRSFAPVVDLQFWFRPTSIRTEAWNLCEPEELLQEGWTCDVITTTPWAHLSVRSEACSSTNFAFDMKTWVHLIVVSSLLHVCLLAGGERTAVDVRAVGSAAAGTQQQQTGDLEEKREQNGAL